MYRFPFSVTCKGPMKSKALVSYGAETSTCLIVGFSDSWTWFPFLAKHSVLTPCTNIRRLTRPVKSRLDFLKGFLLLCIWFMVSFLVDFERLIVKGCTYHRFCTVKEVFLTLSKVHCFKRISILIIYESYNDSYNKKYIFFVWSNYCRTISGSKHDVLP